MAKLILKLGFEILKLIGLIMLAIAMICNIIVIAGI